MTAIQKAILTLDAANTHSALSIAVSELKLTALEWKTLAKEVTGIAARSGKEARQMIENRYSDRLLLNERIEQVKRSFAQKR